MKELKKTQIIHFNFSINMAYKWRRVKETLNWESPCIFFQLSQPFRVKMEVYWSFYGQFRPFFHGLIIYFSTNIFEHTLNTNMKFILKFVLYMLYLELVLILNSQNEIFCKKYFWSRWQLMNKIQFEMFRKYYTRIIAC